MRLYIGRTKWDEGNQGCYEIGSVKSAWSKWDGFTQKTYLLDFFMEPARFEEIFGLKLAPGEIRKVKKITIEVE